MNLRLGGAGADGTPGDEVGDVLGRDGVEQLGADGDAHRGEVAEELAGEAEALVDLERAVNVGVVDEALPADSRARFLDQTVSHVFYRVARSAYTSLSNVVSCARSQERGY